MGTRPRLMKLGDSGGMWYVGGVKKEGSKTAKPKFLQKFPKMFKAGKKKKKLPYKVSFNSEVDTYTP